MSVIARKLREVRKNLGLSQAEFGKAIGAAQGSVSKWEAGRETPRYDALLRISKIYGISLTGIHGEKEHLYVANSGMRSTRVVGSVQSGFGVERITWDDTEHFEIAIPIPDIWQAVKLSAWTVKGSPIWDRWPPGSIIITAAEIENDDDLADEEIWPSGFDIEDGEYVVASIKRDDLFEVCVRKFVRYDENHAALFPAGSEQGRSAQPVEFNYGGWEAPDVQILGLIVATIRYEVDRTRLIHIPDG